MWESWDLVKDERVKSKKNLAVCMMAESRTETVIFIVGDEQVIKENVIHQLD